MNKDNKETSSTKKIAAATVTGLLMLPTSIILPGCVESGSGITNTPTTAYSPAPEVKVHNSTKNSPTSNSVVAEEDENRTNNQSSSNKIPQPRDRDDTVMVLYGPAQSNNATPIKQI